MATPISVRFREPNVAERLRREAAARAQSQSALAEELIDEGLRQRRHPLVTFRAGPAGRRAALAGGPDVWEVIGGVIGGDVDPDDRLERAATTFGVTATQVEAALAYYAEFTDEVDAMLDENRQIADEAEQQWHRRRQLLAR